MLLLLLLLLLLIPVLVARDEGVEHLRVNQVRLKGELLRPRLQEGRWNELEVCRHK